MLYFHFRKGQVTTLPSRSSNEAAKINLRELFHNLSPAQSPPQTPKMAQVETSNQDIDHLKSLIQQNAKRSRALFAESQVDDTAALEFADRVGIAARIRLEYDDVRELPPALAAKQASAAGARKKKPKTAVTDESDAGDARATKLIEGIMATKETNSRSSTALTVRGRDAPPNANGPNSQRNLPSSSLVRKGAVVQQKPEWHAPWKLMRVISGHLGWVRSLAVEPENKWFASGAGDRTIKIWDLATGNLRLTLTGHISTVRGLAVSPRHPYLFSCGEDKMVKCWDLETNKVIRHYHGHLSEIGRASCRERV